MCFTRQPRALNFQKCFGAEVFRCVLSFWLQNAFLTAATRNFQKCSENVMLLSFWLWNALRATAACNFWSLIRQDGSAPAGLASLLFDLPEPQKTVKHECLATFLPCRPLWYSFFLSCLPFLFLFADLLSTDSFSSPTFSPLLPHLSTCRKFDF